MPRNESLNSSSLKSFRINGLFGFKNIEILFEKQSMILIAENGAGKTTILNALYYCISCNFPKLSTINFDSIVLKFRSGEVVEIQRNDALNSLRFEVIESGNFSLLQGYLDPNEIGWLLGHWQQGPSYDTIDRRLEVLARRKSKVEGDLLPILLDSIDKDYDYQKSENIKSQIKNALKEYPLYFPTYRRIEEDLNNLGYQDDKFNESLLETEVRLIQFGMNDVVEKINKITQEIKDSALNLFSKVTGEMLSQFVDKEQVTPEMRQHLQPDTLKIILSRVGDKNISAENRKKIENLVSSEEIDHPDNNQLVYFLSKLLNLYELQKEKDESIKNFVKICNQYLRRKQLVYDEVNVKIYIKQLNDDRHIKFKDLSSGEKQIISIFSKIYLEENPQDFIVLFDEPELSLSIEWQRLLLPDILRSGKCKLLIAVTHSPFIFDNELDFNAHDLDSFIKE